MAEGFDSQSQPAKTVRLIFEYEGDQVRLVSQQPVDMAITGFDIAQTEHPGFYVDSRDAGGATLARVAAHAAFAGSAEVFPGEARRADRPGRRRAAARSVHASSCRRPTVPPASPSCSIAPAPATRPAAGRRHQPARRTGGRRSPTSRAFR